MSDENILNRYIDYRNRNNQIKKRQREERERELEPLLVDLGRAIEASKTTDGRSLMYIAALLGLKNRNFLYGAVQAFKGTAPATDATTPPTAKKPSTPPSRPVDDIEYTITGNEMAGEIIVDVPLYGTYTIGIGSEGYELPYEWLNESVPARKALWRRITRELNDE